MASTAYFNCPSCDHLCEPGTRKCPECGKRLRYGIGAKIAMGFGAFAVFSIVVASVSGPSDDAPTPVQSPEVAETTPIRPPPFNAGQHRSCATDTIPESDLFATPLSRRRP